MIFLKAGGKIGGRPVGGSPAAQGSLVLRVLLRAQLAIAIFVERRKLLAECRRRVGLTTADVAVVVLSASFRGITFSCLAPRSSRVVLRRRRERRRGTHDQNQSSTQRLATRILQSSLDAFPGALGRDLTSHLLRVAASCTIDGVGAEVIPQTCNQSRNARAGLGGAACGEFAPRVQRRSRVRAADAEPMLAVGPLEELELAVLVHAARRRRPAPSAAPRAPARACSTCVHDVVTGLAAVSISRAPCGAYPCSERSGTRRACRRRARRAICRAPREKMRASSSGVDSRRAQRDTIRRNTSACCCQPSTPASRPSSSTVSSAASAATNDAAIPRRPDARASSTAPTLERARAECRSLRRAMRRRRAMRWCRATSCWRACAWSRSLASPRASCSRAHEVRYAATPRAGRAARGRPRAARSVRRPRVELTVDVRAQDFFRYVPYASRSRIRRRAAGAPARGGSSPCPPARRGLRLFPCRTSPRHDEQTLRAGRRVVAGSRCAPGRDTALPGAALSSASRSVSPKPARTFR